MRDHALAVRSLELFNGRWPQYAADTYFRLGSVYADPAVGDDTRALAAFRSGMAAVPMVQRDHYRSQLPPRFRSRM